MEVKSTDAQQRWLLPRYFLAGATFLLVLAILEHWNEGFYQFLRLVICALCGTFSYRHFKQNQMLWGGIAAAFTLLFNPAFPIEMNRDSWVFFDIITIPAMWLTAMSNPSQQPKEIVSDIYKRVRSFISNPYTIPLCITGAVCAAIYLSNNQSNTTSTEYSAPQATASDAASASNTEVTSPNQKQLSDIDLIRAATPQMNWTGEWKWQTLIPTQPSLLPNLQYPSEFEIKDLKTISLPSSTKDSTRRLILQTARPTRDYDCHQCQIILSGYIITETKKEKKITEAKPLLDTIGHYGNFVTDQFKTQIMTLKNDDALLLIADMDMAQGYYNNYWQVYGILNSKIIPLGGFNYKTDNSGNCSAEKSDDLPPCVSESSNLKLTKGNGAYPDILVLTAGTTIKEGMNIAIPFEERKRYQLELSPMPKLKQIGQTIRKEHIPIPSTASAPSTL